MGKLLALAMCVVLLGGMVVNEVAAREPPIETASLVVRAWGKYGFVRPVTGVPQTSPERPLMREVRAGSIARDELRAQLALGIGRFLQQVKSEPALLHGRFTGWRLLSLFAKRPDVHVSVLRIGDVVSRVNGRSIERPEDFKAVWDTLGEAKELVLDIERDGRPTRVRYAITQ